MEDMADLNEGLGFMEQGKYANAVVSFEEIEKKKGARFEIYELIGICYYNMKDWRNSVRSLTTAASYLESPKPNLVQRRGLARLYLGDFAEAADDLILTIRYTPFETLHERPDLLSQAFFACVLAGDERARKIFDTGYSHCPLRLMEEIQRIFDGYFVNLDISVEEKLGMQERITALLNQAKEDQALFQEKSQLRGDTLKGLLWDLKKMKFKKEEGKNT